MIGNTGFDKIMAEFRSRTPSGLDVQRIGPAENLTGLYPTTLPSPSSVVFRPGTEALSSRGGYFSDNRLLEAFFDITYNLAAYENRPSVVRPPLEFDNSRDRYQYCVALAQEFEKDHPHQFGEGFYPTPEVLKKLFDGNRREFQNGISIPVPDELDDDYILAIDAFCDRKFKERSSDKA